MFFAFAAVACPWHRFQTSLRDRLLADLTHPVGTLSDASDCLFDCSQETTVCLVQADLKLRLLIGIRLLNEIALQATCGWYPGSGVALDRRQFALLLQQQFFVSLEISRACHRLSNHSLALAARKS